MQHWNTKECESHSSVWVEPWQTSLIWNYGCERSFNIQHAFPKKLAWLCKSIKSFSLFTVAKQAKSWAANQGNKACWRLCRNFGLCCRQNQESIDIETEILGDMICDTYNCIYQSGLRIFILCRRDSENLPNQRCSIHLDTSANIHCNSLSRLTLEILGTPFAKSAFSKFQHAVLSPVFVATACFCGVRCVASQKV